MFTQGHQELGLLGGGSTVGKYSSVGVRVSGYKLESGDQREYHLDLG